MAEKTQAQKIGQAAEDIAYDYLQKQGLQLVDRNYRCRMGEIDLIMQEGNVRVFVEVRARKNNLFGGSLASVTYSKQTKLRRAANFYLQQNFFTENTPCRFDVVAITSPAINPLIEWVKNAF